MNVQTITKTKLLLCFIFIIVLCILVNKYHIVFLENELYETQIKVKESFTDNT